MSCLRSSSRKMPKKSAAFYSEVARSNALPHLADGDLNGRPAVAGTDAAAYAATAADG